MEDGWEEVASVMRDDRDGKLIKRRKGRDAYIQLNDIEKE